MTEKTKTMISEKDIELLFSPLGKLKGALVPAIIQDATTKNVLMLGYMNEEALKKTQDTKLVTFFSRTKTDFGLKVKKVVMF